MPFKMKGVYLSELKQYITLPKTGNNNIPFDNSHCAYRANAAK